MKRTPLALALFLIASLASAGEKAAEVPKLGSIGAPLNSSVPNVGGSAAANLSIPSLPNTAVAGSVAPAQSAAAPAQSASSPANPPGPGGSQAATPPAPPSGPYYVEALVKLGAPRELAANLAMAQNARFAAVSNGALELARAREAADIMARTTESRAGYTLSKPQKALLIVTAALRGADLEKDEKAAALLASLSKTLGFSPEQAKTLLAAAKPGMDEARRNIAAAAVKKAAAASFGESAAWASEWAERMTYFERASSFSKAGAGVKLSESPADIQELHRDPNLVFLPVALQAQIKQEALRLSGAPATGPPSAALRQLQAAASEPDKVKVAAAQDGLSALSSSGWAVVPGEAILPAADAQYLLSRIDENWPGKDSLFRTWDLIEGRNWRVNKMHDEPVVAIVQRMMGRLTGMLDAATNEGLVPVEVQLRFGNDHPSGLHVDGGYITATMALRGPGTMIFEEFQNGGLNTVRAGTNQLAVITNTDREFLTNVAGTVHSTPPPTDPKRVVFIIRFRAARTPELNNQRQGQPYKDLEERNRKRVGRIAKIIQAREPSKKPEASGLKGIWSKLFE